MVGENMIKEGIAKLVENRNLTYEESCEIMREIMCGKATSAQIAAFLTALRMKGETVEEITAFAKTMKKFCHKINPKIGSRLVDTCGTGGDKIKTFNISTTAAFIAAGAGVLVAKHGNRSVTSKSGSADVLERLGLNLNISAQKVEESIKKIGIGFMFAPAFHPAMKYAVNPRKEIGIRTVFNILGPLTNPANTNAQVVGVYDVQLLEKITYSLKNLGLEEAMVVSGLDGLDEISTIGKTRIAWLRNGEIKIFETAPKDFNVKKTNPEEIKGVNPEENAEITFKILHGCLKKGDPKRDIAVVNAAAAIIIGGKAEDFSYAIELAEESIENGSAYRKLKNLIKMYDGSNLAILERLELRYG